MLLIHTLYTHRLYMHFFIVNVISTNYQSYVSEECTLVTTFLPYHDIAAIIGK